MSEEKTYWMPEVLPSPTEEYNESQRTKSYLTPDGEEKRHPGWTYENQALVDDDYLLKNEGYRRLIDNYPSEVDDANHIIERTDLSQWIGTSTTVTVKYDVFQIREASYPSVLAFDKTCEDNDVSEWTVDRVNMVMTKTYTVVDLTPEELAIKKESTWAAVREHRNRRLQESDVILLKGLEDGRTISEEVKTYRQALRDFPSTITDITTIDGPTTRVEDDAIWPSKPAESNYYV